MHWCLPIILHLDSLEVTWPKQLERGQTAEHAEEALGPKPKTIQLPSLKAKGTVELHPGVVQCDNAIDENDQSIECHMCKLWNHKRCTELSEAEYRVLEREGESLLWQRNACIRDRAGGNAQASRTDVKLDMLVKLFQDIVQRLEKLEGAYIGKYLEEKIEEAVDKKVTEVLEEAK